MGDWLAWQSRDPLQVLSKKLSGRLPHATTPRNNDMNKARYDSLVHGLNSAAAKVFDATPISEGWALHQIQNELLRRGQSSDFNHVMGCMRVLVNQRLVVERRGGLFQRAAKPPEKPAAKEKKQSAPAAKEEPKQQEIKVTAATKATPIEKLGTLSEKAMKLAADLRSLASEIETVAIEVDEQSRVRDTDGEKLRQLQAILKSLA